MAQDTKEDEGISREITEIGCMCTKCNCKKIVSLMVSICEPCLKGIHDAKLYATLDVS